MLMKNKIKSFVYAVSVFMMSAPALVSAQISDQAGNEGNLPQGRIFEIVQNVMKWLLGLVGFIAVIGFAIAGILYLTAAGDEDRQKTAKRAMLYSIIGVIVALGGWVIWGAVQTALQGGSGGVQF